MNNPILPIPNLAAAAQNAAAPPQEPLAPQANGLEEAINSMANQLRSQPYGRDFATVAANALMTLMDEACAARGVPSYREARDRFNENAGDQAARRALQDAHAMRQVLTDATDSEHLSPLFDLALQPSFFSSVVNSIGHFCWQSSRGAEGANAQQIDRYNWLITSVLLKCRGLAAADFSPEVVAATREHDEDFWVECFSHTVGRPHPDFVFRLETGGPGAIAAYRAPRLPEIELVQDDPAWDKIKTPPASP